MDLSKKKLLFADLDGTLITTVSGKVFPKGVWDMALRFEVLDAIKKMKPEVVAIISNQGGIESGYVDEKNFKKKLEYIKAAISEYCDCLCVGKYCSVNDKNSLFRKPNTGMIESLHGDLWVMDKKAYNESEMLMIGDASGLEGQFSDSDKRTAKNANMDYIDVNIFVKEVL